MTKKEILKWRLSKLPSSDEVLALIKDGVITKEEGKEILFTTETEEERDEAGLKAEIKFLRELVEKLSNKQTDRIIETIKYIEKPYYRYDWYKPYMYYCSTGNNTYTLTGTSGSNTLMAGGANSVSLTSANSDNSSFSAIKTF